ncbi:hypothetical protein KKF82_07345 [Patescibacteria group bacterium]|nr:hypothetical protein [Patescibacteria group bacterium]
MSAEQFRQEINTLLFTMRGNGIFSASILGVNIINDMDIILNYQYGRIVRRYLTWGLCIGRSVDTFTKLFLMHKGVILPAFIGFTPRIHEICNNYVSDPNLKTELEYVRDRRNELFHEAGRHFTRNELRQFTFNAIKSMHQLLTDL